jgi:hypothetical protein
MKRLVGWLKQLVAFPPDPVKLCGVYKDKAGGSCVHVDGPLCDFATCSMRLDAQERGQWGRQEVRGLDPKMKLIRVQDNPDMAVGFGEGLHFHWLFARVGENQWQAMRPLTDLEIMQAEDQYDQGIIIEGGQRYRWRQTEPQPETVRVTGIFTRH